jgi:PAS domain S-box-containing protein
MEKKEFSIPKIPDSELKTALDKIVQQGLVPVSTGLGVLYAIFTASHILTQPKAIALPMAAIAGITSLVFLIFSIFAKRHPIPLPWSYPIGILMVSLALLNSFLHLRISGDIYQTTNVMLIIFGISFFLIKDEWFYPLIAFSVIGWILSITGIPFTKLTTHFVFGLISACALAVIIHLYHSLTTRQLIQANYQERYSVTQLEKIVQEMQKNVERLNLNNQALEAAGSGIMITNRNGIISWINPAFSRMSGYSAEEIIGKTPSILKSDRENPATYQNLWKTILSGEVWNGEIQNRRKDGTVYTEEQIITPVKNQEREITHFIAIKQDVTVRKQTQEELEIRNRELAEMNTIISSITSSLDLDPILQNIVDAVNRILPQTYGATLQMVNTDSTLTTLAASKGLIENKRKVIFKPGAGAAGHAILEQRLINIGDVNHDPRFIPGKSQVPFHSLIAIPIINKNRVIGVLSVEGTTKYAFGESEEHVLTLLAGYAGAAIQNAQYSEHLEEMVRARTSELVAAQSRLITQQKMEQEMKLAVEIQSSLLPDRMPALPGFEIAANAIPAHLVSGDFYDFLANEEKGVCLVLADISGKGVPAAMLTSTARSLMRLSSEKAQTPSLSLAEVNSHMYNDLTKAGMFITILGAKLDRFGKVIYANAGHTEALWWQSSRQSCQRIPVTGMPLGITPELEIKEKEFQLRPGDVLLFYSDGITEANNKEENMFGIGRLETLFANNAEKNAHKMMDTIINAVIDFCEGEPISDDITLMVIKALPRKIPFTYPAKLEKLDAMLSLIHSNAQVYGSDIAYQIELASSEVITNIIKHAYAQKSGSIRGEIQLESNQVQIDLFDSGQPFVLQNIPVKTDQEPHVGGYGLSIVQQLMDRMDYVPSTSQGNHWKLLKKVENE